MNDQAITIAGIGFIVFALTWAVGFTFGWWTKKEVEKCRHDVTSGVHWTQDGWVDICLVCCEWIYYGDSEHPVK